MKVFDLRCESGHGFEGWFGDGAAFLQQQAGGLIECPVCGNSTVQKLLSAPRLNLGAPEPPQTQLPAQVASSSPSPAAPLGHPPEQWLQQARKLVAKAEDVGERFADEARAMHGGDVPARPIRGVASAEQTMELLSEGIPVLPVPPVLTEPLH